MAAFVVPNVASYAAGASGVSTAWDADVLGFALRFRRAGGVPSRADLVL